MAAGGRRFRFTIKLREGLAGYGFLSLNFCGFLCLTLVPVVASIVLAFCYWDLFHPPKFVGLANFKKLLLWHRDAGGNLVWNDPHFWKYLYNTCFLMLAIPVTILLNLFVAMLMTNPLKEITIHRGVWFLPSVAGGVATLLLWKWIFEPTGGLLNTALSCVGIAGPEWLNDPSWAKPAFILMGWWGSARTSSAIGRRATRRTSSSSTRTG